MRRLLERYVCRACESALTRVTQLRDQLIYPHTVAQMKAAGVTDDDLAKLLQLVDPAGLIMKEWKMVSVLISRVAMGDADDVQDDVRDWWLVSTRTAAMCLQLTRTRTGILGRSETENRDESPVLPSSGIRHSRTNMRLFHVNMFNVSA
jgi:hypothetical protein